MKKHHFRDPNKDTSESLLDFHVDKIKDEENIFTQTGLLCAIIDDINKLKKEIKSIQRKHKLIQRFFQNIMEEIGKGELLK